MQAGDRIGPFVVVRRLGAGQMGVVFEVSRPDLPATYALKVLRRELCSVRDVLRFQREVEHLAAVSAHPHVVPIHTAGEDRGSAYYVMDLIVGETLQDKLSRGGAMAPARAATYVRDVASAVTALHRAGIVHRDIKPANIMVDDRDRARLADFGLARSFTDERGRLTQTGELVGTPHFMAPEQALGVHAGPEADVYALGMVLFTLLAGRPAIEGKGIMEVLTCVGSGELLALPSLAPDTPDELVSVVDRCLATDPRGRPTAEQVRVALDDLLRAGPAAGGPPSSVTRALVGLAMTAALLAGIALAIAARRQPVTGPTEVAASRSASPRRPAPPPIASPVARSKPATDWVALARTGDPGPLLTIVRALRAGEDPPKEQRQELLATLARLDERWTDPGATVLLVPEHLQPEFARATLQLILVHAAWRRLDPAHRFPEERETNIDVGVLGPLRDVAPQLDLELIREVVLLEPDDTNHYVMYCDVARDVSKYQREIDLDLIRQGIRLARTQATTAEGPAERKLARSAWARLLRALASYLDVASIGDPAQLDALSAAMQDAEALGWGGTDAGVALVHLGDALVRRRRLAEGLAAHRRATQLAPEALTPAARLSQSLFAQGASPGAPPTWRAEANAALERYFLLLAASSEKDEVLTIHVIESACAAMESLGDDAAALGLCVRALEAVPNRPMARVGIRRVLLLCRQQATPAEVAWALRDLADRAETWAISADRSPDEEFGVVAEHGRSVAGEAKELAAGITGGALTHARVADRLAAAFGSFGIDVRLAPRRR